jgi:hypothetical protein
LGQAAIGFNFECRDAVDRILIDAGAYVVVTVDELILRHGARSYEQGQARGPKILHDVFSPMIESSPGWSGIPTKSRHSLEPRDLECNCMEKQATGQFGVAPR